MFQWQTCSEYVGEPERWRTLLPLDGTTGVPAHAVELVSMLEPCATRKAPGCEFKSFVALRDSLDLSDPIFSHPEMTVLKPCSLCWIVLGIQVKEKRYKSLDETRKSLSYCWIKPSKSWLITWFSFFPMCVSPAGVIILFFLNNVDMDPFLK